MGDNGKARHEVASSAPGGSDRSAKRSRLLIVDDHPDTAEMMARLLQLSGYAVQTAGSVASALELASSQIYDIVVSDIGLPDATGYELMAQIKELYHIKGIALSGYGRDEDFERSMAAGFAEHLVKPVNMEQLRAIIERLSNE
jgi:two-component system, chemotaxis family, CheB/CheR fusion protein